MKWKLFIFIFCSLSAQGNCCTFATGLQETWTSSYYGEITIASEKLTLEKTTFRINNTNRNIEFSCYQSTGSTYVVKSVETFPVVGETGNVFICFEFTQVNSNSYYFYWNSATASTFNNERVSFWDVSTAPTLSDVCSATPSKAEFTSMVLLDSSGSAALAKTNCMSHILGNFVYTLVETVSGSDLCSGTSLLTVCDDRQQLNFNYTLCAQSALYSDSGLLYCITPAIQSSDGSTYYTGLYNADSATENRITTFKFSCIAVSSDGTSVKVSANPYRCRPSQTSTSFATDSSQTLEMTANVTCPFTDDSSDVFNVLPIVLGVLFGLLFIILLVLLICYCCKKKKKRDKIKAHEQRNLRVFEKKMAMNEFDDEHPLNESSLIPDFPQNGYPMLLKISPRRKKYNVIKATDVECQTDRSSMTDREFGPMSNRGAGGHKDVHSSNRSLATQKDFEIQMDNPFDTPHPSSVVTNNKVLKKTMSIDKPPEFPSEPQYLPWPWRTANRAMKTNTTSVKSATTSFKSNTNGIPDLGEFMIKNYGIRYDDTLSSTVSHPPPRRLLSRSNSVYDVSRPPTGMLEMRKTYSHDHLNRSKTSVDNYPTPRTLLSRSMSQNDITRKKSISNKPFPNNQYIRKPPTKPNAPSRRASVANIKNMLHRKNSHMLKPISESRERIPTPLIFTRNPTYMRALTRSKTTLTPGVLRKAANVYSGHPSTGKLTEKSRSLLQTKLKHQKMEKPTRKKRKILRKKRSMWRSPFALPSSIKPNSLSLKTLSKLKHSKVEPTKNSARLSHSLTSRGFTTADETTSDSNNENFLDAETSQLPQQEKKTTTAITPPKREKTYRMEKKLIVSEDSGISADDSASSKDSDHDTRFPLPDIIETNMLTKPGQLKPPPRQQHNPWKYRNREK